jgi:hypothetical protein
MHELSSFQIWDGTNDSKVASYSINAEVWQQFPDAGEWQGEYRRETFFTDKSYRSGCRM